MIDQLKAFRNKARSIVFAALRKSSVICLGRSPVSKTCQIPDLRNRYQALGLSPNKGFFVEIGAYDGESFSNTSFLADQGWQGIYVEPIREFYRNTRLRHALNAVTVENYAIASSAGTASISVMGALTTLHEDTTQLYKHISWARKSASEAKSIEISTETIETALARNNAPHFFDLMVIDVEGGEEQIVQALFETQWRPRVLIVELIDKHDDFSINPALQQSSRRARQAILDAGYSAVYSDAVNTIFSRDSQL